MIKAIKLQPSSDFYAKFSFLPIFDHSKNLRENELKKNIEVAVSDAEKNIANAVASTIIGIKKQSVVSIVNAVLALNDYNALRINEVNARAKRIVNISIA